MMTMNVYLKILFLCPLGIQAHMRMSQPAARGYPNVNLPYDYSLSSPLDPSSGRTFPCGGKTTKSKTIQVQAGSSLNVMIEGTAPHDGGHCQFAFSYNEKDPNSWVVLKTEIRQCLRPNLNYQIPIPANAPNGPVTFGWTWINAVGNREYYMNCADIVITGGLSNGVLTGPKLFIANLPGYPIIPEMINGADDGTQYLKSRPTISIKPKGASAQPSKTTAKGFMSTRRVTMTTIKKPVMSTRTRLAPSPSVRPKPQQPACKDGQYVCVNSMKSPQFIICLPKPLKPVILSCGPGQVCRTLGHGITCDLAG